MLWPEQGTSAETDWEEYVRRTARPGSLPADDAEQRDTEEVVIEPPSRRSRSVDVES